MRLCVWHTITDAELASVVAPDEMIRRRTGSSHDDAVTLVEGSSTTRVTSSAGASKATRRSDRP